MTKAPSVTMETKRTREGCVGAKEMEKVVVDCAWKGAVMGACSCLRISSEADETAGRGQLKRGWRIGQVRVGVWRRQSRRNEAVRIIGEEQLKCWSRDGGVAVGNERRPSRSWQERMDGRMGMTSD